MLQTMVKINPSNANIWYHCAAHPTLSAQYNYYAEQSDAAKIGTAAHWVATQLLTDRVINPGDIAPNEIVVTNAMIDHGNALTDIVQSWGSFDIKLINSMVNIDFGLNVKPTGYIDGYAIVPSTKTVHIIEYKYGHTPVDPFENKQLLCYALALYQRDFINDFTVSLEVFQPNCSHPCGTHRTWHTSFSELQQGYFNDLIVKAQRATQPEPLATVGSHCYRCSARHACHTLQNASAIAVEIAQQGIDFELSTMQASKELSQIDAAIDVLKMRKSGLESQLVYNLTNGDVSEHYMLDRVKSRERWQDGVDQDVINIGLMLGKNLGKSVTAISPAQCRKSGIDESVIKHYCITPQGEIKLVKRDTRQFKKFFKGE